MPVIYNGLGIFDYLVLALVLLISASIGVYYRFSGGRQKSTKVYYTFNASSIQSDTQFLFFLQEYLLADRNMSFIPVAFSLMASFMSSITLLGVSGENYIYGTQFVIINISYIIGTPLAAYFYLPVFYQLQNASVYKVMIIYHFLDQHFHTFSLLFCSTWS